MADSTTHATGAPTGGRGIRLWPGVAAAALLLLIRFGLPLVRPESMFAGIIAGLLLAIVIVLWWAFFSRAPALERWGAVGLMVVALAGTRALLHESIATAGMGIGFFIYAVPMLSLAFVAWAVAGGRLSERARRLSMAGTILVACGAWTLVQTGGVSGGGSTEFSWRWAATPEERLLAMEADEGAARQAGPIAMAAVDASHAEVDWPGFRGLGRDGVVHGTRIETDWASSPPVEQWRRPIGPGWSSFAVGGGLVYTQEQRGEDELVAAYSLATGEPVWRHRDPARFWEANGGAGPRATPTLSGGRLYTFGATGIVNALDAATGARVWSRDAAADTGAEAPFWGFSSSPLVIDDVVVIAADDALVAYDLGSGEPRWFGPSPVDGESYSSPHRVSIGGVPQILLVSGAGAVGIAPGEGRLLWEHPWPGSPIVQPAVTGDGDVLITTAGLSGALGMRRLGVARTAGEWATEERWTSNRLKPYFNDYVVHEGHVYGFDGGILACIDLVDGARCWKGGRYGHGQMVLLADQDVLLVLSEEGEVALVSATSDRFVELARAPAIEGKTWNHPALVGDLLLVRNGQEMAAFRMPQVDPVR